MTTCNKHRYRQIILNGTCVKFFKLIWHTRPQSPLNPQIPKDTGCVTAFINSVYILD